MSYTDPNSVHVPGTGAAIPAAWGTTVATDLNDLNTRANLTKIAESIAGGLVGSVTFSSIPATFRTLVVKWVARGDNATTNVLMHVRINGDAGANYDSEVADVSGAASWAASETIAGGQAVVGILSAASAPANVPGQGELEIVNYAATTFQKVILSRSAYKLANSATNVQTGVGGAHWRQAVAITSVQLFPSAGNFVAGSTFTLYGLS